LIPQHPFRWNQVAARVVELADSGGPDYAPGFVDRARPAALGVMPRSRNTAQANYVTDLGVRISDDAATFLRHNLSRNPAGWDDDLDAGNPWPVGGLDEEGLVGLLDGCVNFAGDWDLARSVCLAVNAGERTYQRYATSLYVGAVLAATSTPDDAAGDAAGNWLRRAVGQAESEVDSFMAGLRLAAWRLKRRGDVKAATRQLDAMFDDVDCWHSQRCVSDADARAMRAVGLNLLAFAHIKTRDHASALDTVRAAASMRDTDGFVTVDRDAALRYQCQIRINLGQVLWLLDHRDEALRILADNEALAADLHPDSLSEAQSILAYYLFLAGEHDRALALLTAAYQRVRTEAAPRRLAQIRKVTAASLHRSGAPDDADRVLHRLHADPLGFDARLVGEAA
jgi:tetratricopeptide (TPR) repeat protein